MLDDRDHYPSWKQFEQGTLWNVADNGQAWNYILSSDDSDEVDEIRCASRATDFKNLPPTFIGIGECEVFRDLAVAFVSPIWKAGGSAELHA